MMRPLRLVVLSLLLAACASEPPPEIEVWSTKCDFCDARIEDLSLAATARSSDGTVKAFDKAACLIRTIPEGDEWEVWFHDHDSEKWIAADDAVFVVHSRHVGTRVTQTPAFVDEEHASAWYQSTPGRNVIAPSYAILRGVLTN